MGIEDFFKGCAKKQTSSGGGCGVGIYMLGFLGALFYYLNTAPSFWVGLVGILKALVWPAFLVYEIFMFFGA
ncbi:MAG: hypothetical protein JW789_02085 [Candidatus Aenigmarchaeota archaeon]|nr:hypothetical protein [Candidatus Aenigmarchaeota archaeon]